MLRRVALVRIDVSEELSASFTRVTRIGELGTTLAVTSNRPDEGGANFSETSVLTRATRRNIPEDAILHSHRRENFKFYMLFSCLSGQNISSCSEIPFFRFHSRDLLSYLRFSSGFGEKEEVFILFYLLPAAAISVADCITSSDNMIS
jgi:hypothetical protein